MQVSWTNRFLYEVLISEAIFVGFQVTTLLKSQSHLNIVPGASLYHMDEREEERPIFDS